MKYFLIIQKQNWFFFLDCYAIKSDSLQLIILGIKIYFIYKVD